MKKFGLALLALAAALAITPAALADNFGFAFVSPNGSQMFAFGFLSGTSNGAGGFNITTGTIDVIGGGAGLVQGHGNLIGGTGTTLTSPSGAFFYDNIIHFPVPLSDPYVDNAGLLFLVGGKEVNLFSNIPFLGAGQFSYMGYEGSAGPQWNFSSPGELNVYEVVPEPSALILLGTGLLGLALIVFRKAKPSSSLVLNM